MQLSGNLTSTLSAIPDGKAGIVATLKEMRRIVRQFKKSLDIRLAASRVVANLPAKNWYLEAAALHDYVRDNIRFLRDINGVETLHTPDKILQLRQGDCDDKSILLASMLESIGHPTRFVAVGFAPDNLSHVLVETKIGNRWIPSDTTENVGFGWFPPNVKSSLIIHN